jgi:galactose mutarotase-like enzyme
MLHFLENETLVCTIESNGAEIRSLKNKITGEEYIWQIDASVWGSSAPVLFPAIGKIKENHILFKNKSFAMPKHGIIRNNGQLFFKQNSNSKGTFKLISSEKTLTQYPYKFTFSTVFELQGNTLLNTYVIENQDKLPMQFTCGGHTAYFCPLDNHTQLSDYVIEFPNNVMLNSKTLGTSGLLSSQNRFIAHNDGILTLTDSLFNEDALIFANSNFNWVRLRKKDAKKGVVVRFPSYPHLAIWSKPRADFVCIEPWLGLPDHENESVEIIKKTTLKTINPKEIFTISIATEIET